MNETQYLKIQKNIQFIKEIAIPYYKKHQIPFKSPKDPKTPISSLIPKISKRKIEDTPSLKKYKTKNN
jgi:hypothetical protein